MSSPSENSFLQGPLGSIYIKTALPVIFVMGMNGLLSVADAWFLGRYVGPDALAAVTLMFPIYMLVVALATLVSNGMSSLLAREFGAGDSPMARTVFAQSHGLAVALGALLIVLFLSVGEQVVMLAAGGSETLADMGVIYLRITIFFSPLLFVLGINQDALRNEGRVGFMAAMSLFVSVANILFNYVLIAQLEMGVAGSAYGTALAQLVAFVILLVFRLKGDTQLRPRHVVRHFGFSKWPGILALGAPQSLGFVGLALGSGSVVIALQFVASPTFTETMTAYGIITRVLTFVFLPLLGLGHAMQTITGNNFGAKEWRRTDQSVKIGILIALIYCISFQLVLTLFAEPLALMFVSDPVVVAEVGRILPILTILFFATGPLMMVATYFQAIGDAGRAAILGLTKPYLFALPLTFILSSLLGESGIWIAGPLSEFLLFVLTAGVLLQVNRSQSLRWGLFRSPSQRMEAAE
ncbi:MAG: MATE family efflux transporter [Thalassovita sp.]